MLLCMHTLKHLFIHRWQSLSNLYLLYLNNLYRLKKKLLNEA